MVEKQASSEIAQSRERFEKEAAQVGLSTVICMSPNAGDAYGDYGNFDTSTAWHFWQAAERDTRERIAQDAKTIANLADEIYMSLRNFVDHAADCMYHRTDSPHGDVCVCRVQERCREIRAKVKQAHELAERIRGKE